ncbi:hypothetical protein C2W59_01631 [Bacillus pumilus]|nr:hypothetical protein C2W59_01631 [Bacillus pumilus]
MSHYGMRHHPIQSYIGNNRLGKWGLIFLACRQSLASRVQIRWKEMKAIVPVKTIAYESIISF